MCLFNFENIRFYTEIDQKCFITSQGENSLKLGQKGLPFYFELKLSLERILFSKEGKN